MIDSRRPEQYALMSRIKAIQLMRPGPVSINPPEAYYGKAIEA